MSKPWKFDDAPNTACITTVDIVAGRAPITEVYHDYGGGWQFLNSRDMPLTADDGRVVCLSSIVELDESISELHELDFGWRAFRNSPAEKWATEKNHPFPEFSRVGYYLENAEWIAQYVKNVNPPPLQSRESLVLGQRCKLIFRFRHEQSAREDRDSERMWVVITDVDEHNFYTGTLLTTPVANGGLAEGDEIPFHPTHIIEVDDVG